jgi:hypothetical protein
LQLFSKMEMSRLVLIGKFTLNIADTLQCEL